MNKHVKEEIYYDESLKRWMYSDTKTICDDNRPCKRCGRLPTKEGYDACLGYIEGTMSACCGHGVSCEFCKENNKPFKKEGCN